MRLRSTYLEPNGDTGRLETDEQLVIPSFDASVPVRECISERVTTLSVYAKQDRIWQITFGKRAIPLSFIFALRNAGAAATPTDASICGVSNVLGVFP